jgi:PAS domain S-box-containing protein
MPEILAIDDKQDNLITLSALLTNLMPDCSVVTARSGPEGIVRARTQALDAILLDVKMPEMDGFETCRLLYEDERTRHIPVILITAIDTDARSRDKGLSCGAHAFLAKPIDPSELVSQVRVALRIKKAEDELRRQRDSLEIMIRERTDSLRRSEERFRLLAEIGRVLGSSLDLREVYERLAAEVGKVIPYDRLLINLRKNDAGEFTVAYISGEDNPRRRLGDTYPGAGSATGVVMQTRSGILIQPGEAEEIRGLYPNLYETFKAGLRSTLSVPLISNGEVIGSLNIRSRKLRAYTKQDLQLAEKIGMQIAGAIANARLYSELKKTEQSLRESEERFRLAYATSPDAININRMSDGLYVDVNEGFTRLTGYSREDVIGRTSGEINIWCHPEDRQALVRGLQSTGYYENLEADFRMKDGSVTTALMSARVLELGGVPHILSITRDIGDRKRMEEENRRLGERLQRAEKMEALGTLAGGVAHDLNNVLGIVVGYAGLLLEDATEASPLRPDLLNILRGGERAAAIVQDLLTLARRGVVNRTVLNLSGLVQDWLNSPEFKAIASRHPSVQVRADLEPSSLNLSGSLVHLCKTLSNLVMNGCEAMPAGGVLTIRTANGYMDRPVSGYDDVREGDYVLLSVSDTGEGIPAEDLARIFEPFYTKKVMGRSGTGLGLAVVWGTVKDHSGYINVESAEGRGSTFTLYFPVTREEAAAGQAAIPVDAYRGRGESILVVDDVAGQRELAAAMLRKLHYEVATVSSGEEAVARLREHPADLLVLDMIMDPGMDGLETYRKALEIRPGQKAIIVSGFSESERVCATQALGAGAYVKKPYVLENLGLAVRQELERNFKGE